jgi:hypothetical protein
MAEFPHPDLIPRKFRSRLHDMPPYLGEGYVLVIDHDFPPNQKGVHIPLKEADLHLTRKQTLERFIKPALSVLEAHIDNG